ncbi:two component transcriptional regulator, LuxR family [Sulfobacillus acidophilus DSM 10332]|uniref:Stage 0 sporulation protein A homolog n=1 Tax=Sulfobacillus acidophilus (strain ATCC 700253 / DSM 10332 / NAL) TaxID=679936 RepID=G8TYA3_SULAD|nr:two component transcriptional regulator, LuxR family [Sulfobacillus acidophilus DSM 10332]
MAETAADVVRVAIVDDHEVVRVGLRNMIDRQPDLTVVAECATGTEAIQTLPHQTDVVVLDVRLPDISGFDVCRALKEADPKIQVIMLTSFGKEEMVLDAIDAGASGYLLKEARGHTVLEGIRTVAQGGSLFSPQVTNALFQRLRNGGRPQDPIEELTDTEKKILELVAMGKTNREIGQELFLSEKTIKHYVSNILSKLGYTRRAEAAAHYARYYSERVESSDDPG